MILVIVGFKKYAGGIGWEKSVYINNNLCNLVVARI